MDNRRSLPTIVIDSRAQLRTALPFFVLLITGFGMFVVSYWQVLIALAEDRPLTPENMAMLAALTQISNRMMNIGIIGMFIMGVFSILLWLLYSHRIFGPTVPIRRHINSLCEGNYDSRIKLRKHDELQDVAEDLNRLADVLRNQKGQSLIQVLVGVAIMGIAMAAMVSMQTAQSRESRALLEKIAVTDLYRTLSANEANTATCTTLFAAGNLVAPSTTTFDATAASVATPFVINLNQVTGAGGAPVLVALGTAASPMSSTLQILPVGGIQVSVTSSTTANLLINFDQTKLVRGIHNLVLPLTIQISGPPLTSTTITGCGSASGGVVVATGNIATPGLPTTVMCPPGAHLMSCSIRNYSGTDGQGYAELQLVTYLDASSTPIPTPGGYLYTAGQYVLPPGSTLMDPHGCSYTNIDVLDSAQVVAICQ